MYLQSQDVHFAIVLFIWWSYGTVTEETSKSPSGRHGNKVDRLVVSYYI